MRKIREVKIYWRRKNIVAEKNLQKKYLRDFYKREIKEEKLRKWKSNLEWKKFPPRSQEKVIFEKNFREKILGKKLKFSQAEKYLR